MAVGQIISRAIATGAIGADQIATGAITAADIPAGEITADKLHTTLDLSSKTVTMPQASITAHQAALSITESQVSDLQSYVLPNTSPTFTNTTLTGYLAGPATFTIDPAGVGDNTGTVVIAGNLQVDGTTTTINSTTLTVDDLNITLADGAANAAAASGAGITVAGANATITYDATNDEWDFNKDVNVTGNVYSSGYVGVGTTTAYSASTDFEVKATNPKMVFNNTGIRAFGLRVTGTNFQIRDESDNETWLTITHTGIIGIGTTAPSTTASGYEGGTLHIHNAGTGSSIRLTNSTTGTGTSAGLLISKWSDSKTYFTNFDDGADMVFTPTDSGGNLVANTFVIKGDGKIGIGTASPVYQLHVNSGATNIVADFESTDGIAGIRLRDNSGNVELSASGNDFRVQPAGSTAEFVVKNGGNVGIGTTTPTHKLEVAGTTKAEQYLLDAIAKDISDTAVDVFVYDTRKDSDGGAWRKRTQHTSWYNETLGTATRGSRKEFPAVAVIVAETTKVTIYDGDDPDLPMWMVFTWSGAVDNLLGYSNRAKSAITVVNGYLITCSDPDGIHIARFIHDDGIRYTHVNHVYTSDSIANRTNTTYRTISNNSAQLLVASTCNDITATVLPNAPIDSVTGLPIPTIAVATDGGVSVIKDDGTVVDITHSGATYNYWSSVNFTKDNKLIIDSNYQGTSNNITHVVDIPTVDVSQNVVNARITSLNGRYYHSDSSIPNISLGGVLAPSIAPMQVDTFAMGGDNVNYGLDIIAEYPETVSGITSDAMVAYIKNDYNTGWMPGDIKLATLIDTDDTDVSATNTEFLTGNDSSFTSGLGSWQGFNATLSRVNNALRVADNGGYSSAYQTITTVVGKQYVFSAIVSNNGDWATISAGSIAPAGNAWGNYGYTRTQSNGTFTFTFTATATTTYLILGSEGSTSTDYDSLSLKEAEEDRSVNRNGLQVFGTVTKSAVATGADLVSYRSSSGSYLGQPSAGNLVLTDDFSVTWWQKHDTVAGIYEGWQIAENDITGASNYSKVVISAMHEVSSAQYLIRGNNVTGASVSNGIDSGSWTCLTLTKKGSTIKLYTNGELSVTTTGTTSTPSNPYSLEILRWSYATTRYYTANSELSLFRTSNTVPSAEQIKKIYEDEKVLFQENAKCTLYGSSDSVTALAYDDDTELLHVGGPQGRSVFQGLRRIDNTTDAVGSAISASNGMVAED